MEFWTLNLTLAIIALLLMALSMRRRRLFRRLVAYFDGRRFEFKEGPSAQILDMMSTEEFEVLASFERKTNLGQIPSESERLTAQNVINSAAHRWAYSTEAGAKWRARNLR